MRARESGEIRRTTAPNDSGKNDDKLVEEWTRRSANREPPCFDSNLLV